MISLTQMLRSMGLPLGAFDGLSARPRQPANAFNDDPHGMSGSRSALMARIELLIKKNEQIEATSMAKTRLFAAAIHDLSQPLQALMLFSDALSCDDADPIRLERIGHIRESVNSLDRMFTGLLDLTQLDAGRMLPKCRDLPLDPLFGELRQNFQAVAEAKGLRLVVRHTQSWVHGDSVMLTRILNNLVTNSLRNTQSGGVIVGTRNQQGVTRIDVCDTGVGIAHQHQARVFDEFYRIKSNGPVTHGEGLGIGLSTVKRLADLQDAKVRLQSQLGRGTVVSVLLPNPKATYAIALKPSQSAHVPASPSIL